MSDTPADLQSNTTQIAEQKFLNILAQVAICFFLLVLFLYGACITGLVLKEPDICFLLGGGRWILEHGQLPPTDPFSYTTHYHPVAYVIEKWLTEVIFSAIETSLGLTALLVFDSIVLTTTFVVIPFRIAHLCGLSGGAAMRLALLGLLTSCAHLALRPEIFSFLFAAIWFEIMVRTTIATAGNAKIRWDFVAILAVLMCLWSNMHTLFMVGILIPGFYSLCSIVERFVPSTRDKPFNLTVPIITVACIAASLVNPYGIGLWTYMPNVFGPFNDTNNEMQPIKLSSIANPFFYPFFLLALLSLMDFIKSWRKPLFQGDLFFRGLIPLGVFGGFKTIRSIPLCDLFLVSGVLKVSSASSRNTVETKEQSPLTRMTNPFKATWPASCLIAACLGAYLCSFAVTPEVPQSSAAFKPPFQAIEFIRKNPPSGNLLNDPHFGAVMIYKMSKNPPVFIDPRYNLYGNQLLQDYWHMVNGDSGYLELMTKYKIDWVFLAPSEKLVFILRKNPGWQLLYSDDRSVIIGRRSASGNTAR